MNTFIEFLVRYWQFISTGILFVITLIAIFVKRRPKTLDDFYSCLNDTLCLVPIYVKVAEDTYGSGNGNLKKKFVINELFERFKRAMKRAPSESEEDRAIFAIESQLESVLAAPQKKGD